MLAAKKKKKKAKSTEGDGFGMEGIDAIEDTDSGVGIHRDQEGVDTPYVVELGGATSLLQLDSKASGIQEKRWSRKIEVEGHICMRFGKFFIGPEIGILSGIETRKYDETTATVQSSGDAIPTRDAAHRRQIPAGAPPAIVETIPASRVWQQKISWEPR